MEHNFTYYNPTKIYFGKDSINNLEKELQNYGKKVLLVYGGGSIKKIGLYDQVINILKKCNKEIYELSNVLPNPLYTKILEGSNIVKKEKIDLILAVGGGSVIDCCKGIAAGACSDDPWNDFWINYKPTPEHLTPIGTILTMTGTGSEMNGGSVITNDKLHLKKGRVFGPTNYPKFSILNPTYTYTVPEKQMVSGIFDIFSHLMEQYFSDNSESVSDYLLEGLMKSIISATPKAIINPKDYEARSNIMWASTMALNTITGLSKSQDWNVHSIEHQISAYTDCPHGLGLASISPSYYRHIYKYGLNQFAKFATNVFNINSKGKTKEELALEGINKLEEFIKANKMHYSLKELGCTKEMLPLIAKSCDKDEAGYLPLTEELVLEILNEVF